MTSEGNSKNQSSGGSEQGSNPDQQTTQKYAREEKNTEQGSTSKDQMEKEASKSANRG